MNCRIGVDTGGTHTDIVLIKDEREIFTTKVPTTPDDHSRGVLAGLQRIMDSAAVRPDDISQFAYGTTQVTNLLIERDADTPVGLLTTRGFRDVLEIRRAVRGSRYYDIRWRPDSPLVARHLRLDVNERIGPDGSVIVPLDEDDLRAKLNALVEAGVDSVAICFLHSYANPVHERRATKIIATEFPQLEASASSDLARLFREYERMSTTTLSAYVRRPMARHLGALAKRLSSAGIKGSPYIMRANGGLITFDSAAKIPVAITHSGPTAGIIAGMTIAQQSGIQNVITFDMGGTSADVAMVVEGKPITTGRGSIMGWPVVLPMLDLVTVGAGGGSIAWIDQGGLLKVGPRSAGSVPGPACYGQGGTEATITDANLVLGRLNPNYFLGGRRRLDVSLATAAVQRLAMRLDIHLMQAAAGIVAIGESHMINAVKQISIQRGFDQRDFTLIAFGGCGPLHAIGLAEELSIRNVVVPPAAGNVSAMGLLAADIRHDFVRTRISDLGATAAHSLKAEFEEMAEEGMARLDEEGVPVDRRRLLFSVDLCYLGQNFELTIPVSADIEDAALALVAQRFHDDHHRTYGFSFPQRPVRLVNLRLTALGLMAGLPAIEAIGRADATRRLGDERTETGGKWDTVVVRAGSLSPGSALNGPALIEYEGTTLFLKEGWSARYDKLMNAHLTRVSAN